MLPDTHQTPAPALTYLVRERGEGKRGGGGGGERDKRERREREGERGERREGVKEMSKKVYTLLPTTQYATIERR